MRIRSWLLAAALPLAGAAAELPTEHRCVVVVPDGAEGAIVVEMRSLRVLEQTARPGAFELPYDAPADVQSVMCDRSTPVPAPNDYKVVEAGFPLYIGTLSGPAPTRRMVVLERPGADFRLRVLQGDLTTAERAAVDARLGEFRKARNAAPAGRLLR